MSLETLNTAATVGTFVVIAASAAAALVQLRHIRAGNQLTGLLKFIELLQDPANRELLNFVRQDLGLNMKDRAFRESIDEVPIDRAKHPELYVCQLYEHIGSYVRAGLIDERTFMLAAWYDVQLYWRLLEPGIRIGRRKRPFTFENFEWLAAKAQAWAEKHLGGNYPSALPRMVGEEGLEPPASSL